MGWYGWLEDLYEYKGIYGKVFWYAFERVYRIDDCITSTEKYLRKLSMA